MAGKQINMADPSIEPPKAGMVVWGAIHSVVDGQVPEFNLDEFGLGVNDKGNPGLWYRVAERDLKNKNPWDWAFIWTKMNSFVDTLSLMNFGNSWLGDQLWCENKLVWERPKGIPLIPDLEGDPSKPEPVLDGAQVGATILSLMYHIATQMPTVWIHHQIGCYLLRNSFPGHEFDAESLLNFFKIGEVVTAKMYSVKPKLADIQRASEELGLQKYYSAEDIRRFYKVRSRDAAHDWLNVERVKRADAVHSKLWSELMVQKNLLQKGEVFQVVRRAR